MTQDWDTILTLGAAMAEEAGLRVTRAEDVPHVLASALAWALLRQFWSGDTSAALRRWQDDVPDAMARYADRIGIEKCFFKAP